ncbi:MAG TPA: hypothetical protein VHD15_14740 [Hyphomicrobiales bacterium]|nr:hypothetical protein [Hyphomicrobiales bacterium]
MRFLFRAAFWLLVMSAIIPARGGAGAGTGPSFGDTLTHSLAAAGEAVSSWCSGEPGDCLVLARAGAGAVQRVAAAANTAAPAQPAPPVTVTGPAAPPVPEATAAVPFPAARPPRLGRS